MARATAKWWTAVSFGSSYDGPRGPWLGKQAAERAVSAWRARKGAEAGSIEAASSLRIVGPFATRAIARNADISDYTNYVLPPE